MKASKQYKQGLYNNCSFEVFPDGTQIISMYNAKSKGKKHTKFKVKNLNKKNEQVLEDEDD